MATSGSVLIVGGAGYIGSHVNKELNRRGVRTVVADNLCTGHRELVKWGKFSQADLAEPGQFGILFEAFDIQAVMHFASFIEVAESVADPAKYYTNNVANTLNLLKAMLQAGVDKLIFSSTAAVYGTPEKTPVTESHPCSPLSPYGWGKLMVERMLEDFHRAYGMKYVSLRYFNAAGADPEAEVGEWHVPETHLIPLALDAAMGRSGPLKVFGRDYPTRDGTAVRDFVHVTDLARAHVAAMDYLLGGGGNLVCNLGTSTGCTVKEVIDTVSRVTGRDVPVKAAPRREGDPPVLVADSARAVEVLGWRPELGDLDTIVKTAWAWHPKRYRSE